MSSVLTQENELDGTSYSLWSFLVRNLLVAKKLVKLLSDEARLVDTTPTTPPQGVGRAAAPAPTVDQKKWDYKDA